MRLFVHPDRSEWASIVERPTLASREAIDAVRPIFEAVRTRGDIAVRELTREFDGVWLDEFRVPPESLRLEVSSALAGAIDVAIANIETFHRAQLDGGVSVQTMPGVLCWRKRTPIRRVGLYIPGGSAPLLSTVLMLAIPAGIAGCDEIVLCTPPGHDGVVDPALLYAAKVTGVTDIYRVGGAQAIAAMAYGTESIPRVDKIFGPGNQYVTAGKQYAAAEGVAIDLPAGPTEVAIVTDESGPMEFVTCDVLAQAEHGPDSHIVLITTSQLLARKLIESIDTAVVTIPRVDVARKALDGSVCVVLSSEREAIDLCNEYAPEHLILATRSARELAELVQSAGSVFVGLMSPEAAGDYASGTNHTLPTGGAARAYSGVSVESFMTSVTFQQLTEDGIRRLGPTVMELARAEGLEGHSRSVSVRLEALES